MLEIVRPVGNVQKWWKERSTAIESSTGGVGHDNWAEVMIYGRGIIR